MAIADAVGEAKQDLTEFKKLTLQKQEILDVMIQGLSDREIAAALFISDGTIRSYIRNRVNRLDAGDRSQSKYYVDTIFENRYETLKKDNKAIS